MNVNFVMQGKGGVGKTLVSSFLAQYFLFKNKNIMCYDTDPVNATFSAYKSLNVKQFQFMQDQKIISTKFDDLIEDIIACKDNGEEAPIDEIIVDNGAPSFLPLSSYMINNDLIDVFKENDIHLSIHIVIAGSQALIDCLNGMNSLITNFTTNGKPENLSFYIWLNSYQGKIQLEGKEFTQMKAFINNQEKINSVIEIPQVDQDVFGTTFNDILKNRKTFKEGYEDLNIRIMARQRLKRLEKNIFDLIGASGL